ncbi:hypothetical protein KSF78_0009680 [Schistosoma japonicum]|nr:hypothetical protein KSF78_0009680 [Schistosoma japonicum]
MYQAVAQHTQRSFINYFATLSIAILASIFTLLLATTVENNLRNEQQTGCTYGLVAVYLLASWSFIIEIYRCQLWKLMNLASVTNPHFNKLTKQSLLNVDLFCEYDKCIRYNLLMWSVNSSSSTINTYFNDKT